MSGRRSNCAVCGGSARVWFNEFRKCTSCGFAWMSDMPSSSQLDDFYRDNPLDPEWDSFISTAEWPSNFYEHRLRRIERFVSPGALLDVGVGFGRFLEVAHSRWPRVVGLDITPRVVEYVLRNRGLKVDLGVLRDLRYGSSTFDCIHMKDVIEHMPDAMENLAECARIARPGAVLVIETLNIDSIYARARGAAYRGFVPGHVAFFGPRSIRTALERTGFKLMKLYAGDEIPLKNYSRLRPKRMIAKRVAKRIHFGELYFASFVAYAQFPSRP
ncbi:class I SAM-dependent methyltransferase [bacterium]|nr:MAG: class I SAM-dependent methyltransferase [bacterium]